jgi:hypothetical protein
VVGMFVVSSCLRLIEWTGDRPPVVGIAAPGTPPGCLDNFSCISGCFGPARTYCVIVTSVHNGRLSCLNSL